MTEMEKRYCKMLEGLGMIKERALFYSTKAEEILSHEGPGSVSGIYYNHKAIALQEVISLLEEEF